MGFCVPLDKDKIVTKSDALHNPLRAATVRVESGISITVTKKAISHRIQ